MYILTNVGPLLRYDVSFIDIDFVMNGDYINVIVMFYL